MIPVSGQPIELTIQAGASGAAVLKALKNKGLLTHPLLAKIQLKLMGATHLKAGEYDVRPGDAFADVIGEIQAGRVLHYPLTIIEGWTVQQMRQAVNHSLYLLHDSRGIGDQSLMAAIGQAGKLAQGQFFPTTYVVTRGESDFVLFKQAYRQMQNKLNVIWAHRLENLPYHCPNDLLIAASLIEREGRGHIERGKISDVIARRLKLKMRLQLDSTVEYAHAHKAPRFNTYLYLGLPPTPIALPSEESVYLAAHPTQTSYRYFVADGRGKTVFSKTLAAHRKVVRAYRATQKSKHGQKNRGSHD